MLNFVLSLTQSAINLNDLKCQSLPAGSYRSILYTKGTHQPTNLFPHCFLVRLRDLQIQLQRVCGLIFYTYTKHSRYKNYHEKFI